ncbi:DctP TRAP-type C4-dicarboxylate transport system, periplasmic component [Burkholderiaceae bacterium]
MNLKRICTALAMAGCMSFATSSIATTELTASVWFPDSHPLAKFGYVEWAKKVEAASKGDIKIKVFTGTALLSPNTHLSGLRDGVADLTYHAGTYTPSDLPEDNVLSILGIGLKDPIATTFAVADFYMTDPAMLALWKRQRIVFLGAYASVPYNLICRKKIETLSDMKGLKVRTAGVVHSEWAKLVGATPVNVPSSEMFTGLDKGQIDCTMMGANDMKARSLWDVAKFINVANLGPYFAGWEWAMNGNTWKKLKPEQRRILLDTIADATVDLEVEYIMEEKQALKEAPSKGVTIIQPSEDIKNSLQAFSKVARDMAIKEGTNRFKLKDSEGLVTRFETTLAKWEKLLEGVDRNDRNALKKILKENLYQKINASSYGL